MRYLFAVLVLLMFGTATPAFAKVWVTDYSLSSVTFQADQSGQTVQGRFKNFTTDINFDADKLPYSKISATIDVASAFTGKKDVDANIHQPDWFDSKQFPKATFTSNYIEATSTPSCYDVHGTLTLKNLSKDINMNFCLAKEGDHMRAKGTAKIIRNDFAVGVGEWADEGVVGREVVVNLDIIAR